MKPDNTELEHSIINASQLPDLTRRGVLKAGAGLTLAVMAGPVITACADKGTGVSASTAPLAPDAFVRIGADNLVTVISRNTELGQGAYTGLATIMAEELDADWSQVVVKARRRTSSATPTRPSVLCRARAAALPSPARMISCAEPGLRRAPCWSPRPPRSGRSPQPRSRWPRAS